MNDIDAQTRRMEEATEWLLRLQEDELSDEEILQWVGWCEVHPGNRSAFQRLLPLWQAFDSQPKRRNYRKPFALAAAALLAVTATIAAYFATNTSNVLRPDEIATLQSGTGEIRPAVLPDGSRLDLGARTSVAIDFAGAQRAIELDSGEAFFTVAPDRTRPFVVRAGALRITAIGTRFNVLKSAARVVVTVQEGAVQIDSSSAMPQPLLAHAGQQVIHDPSQSEPTLRPVDPAPAIAWRSGRLEYISEPLSSIVSTLNRYSDTQIIIDDPKLEALHYTGTIEVASLQEWLHALPRIFPVQIDTGADHAIRIASYR